MKNMRNDYLTAIEYTYGYYGGLNPLRVKLAFSNANIVAPKIRTACELGFGQGISVNIHASASTTEWHGIDFNPSPAGLAQELATVSGSTAKLYDETFSDFANRSDLPGFDYIGLHGIWTWISDENRRTIVNFIRRKLNLGGVLYIGYNSLPGWATFAPMRHLLMEHAGGMGSGQDGIVGQIDGAIAFADSLLATDPKYAKDNPSVAPSFANLKKEDRNYVAHEYFNRDWHPMYFSQMLDWLSPAKMTYVCSADPLEHVDSINLTVEQQKLLGGLSDPMFQQSTRDYMVNQEFRRDYWVKGPRHQSPIESVANFRELKVMLATPRADVDFKVEGVLGETNLNPSVYAPILDVLADHQTRSIQEIENAVQEKQIHFPLFRQAIVILIGSGHLELVQESKAMKTTAKYADRLNAHLIEKASVASHLNYLASPVTGGGIKVGRLPRLFLMAIKNGAKKPDDWVHFVWNKLSSQGEHLRKDGKALRYDQEGIDEMMTHATDFAEKQLPILRALKIAK